MTEMRNVLDDASHSPVEVLIVDLCNCWELDADVLSNRTRFVIMLASCFFFFLLLQGHYSLQTDRLLGVGSGLVYGLLVGQLGFKSQHW